MNLPDLIESRRDIRLRPVAERTSAIIEYRLILVSVLRELRAEMNRSVIPAYQADRDFQLDSESWFVTLKAVARNLVENAVQRVAALFRQESRSHARRLGTTIRRSTGVDIAPEIITGNSREERLARDYIERNASLIRSVSDDTVKRIEQAVYAAKLDNQSTAQLSKSLQKDFRIVKNRADLIAVDQMASLNADLTQLRHQELGIEKYIWVTRGDDRVRRLHRQLNGNQYTWGESCLLYTSPSPRD